MEIKLDKSFDNFFDRFRKPKYQDYVFRQDIKEIQDINTKILRWEPKVIYTAISLFRRFYFVKHALEYESK